MFKFTIREAILMTTIVAVLLMWWMERSQNAKYDARLTAIETRLQASGIYAPTFIPAVLPPPMGVLPAVTIPAPPITPQSTSSKRGAIPMDSAPTIPPNLPPKIGPLIPRIETVQKSIQDSN